MIIYRMKKIIRMRIEFGQTFIQLALLFQYLSLLIRIRETLLDFSRLIIKRVLWIQLLILNSCLQLVIFSIHFLQNTYRWLILLLKNTILMITTLQNIQGSNGFSIGINVSKEKTTQSYISKGNSKESSSKKEPCSTCSQNKK